MTKKILAICMAIALVAVSGTGMQTLAVAEDVAAKPIYAIAIHGGCGKADRLLPQEIQQAYRDSLRSALALGQRRLRKGGRALDVVEVVARAMEDDGNFNAGKGAVFNREGKHELDASIMDGRTMSCGAVAGVRTIRNPISLARKVMEHSEHVLLAGAGAEQFATAQDIATVDPDYFYTPRTRQLWEAYQKEQQQEFSRLDLETNRGTIGVVALDVHGDLAAATSTGGMSLKMPGRVGDSPIIGAGTYARNGVCAVSCTGRGEEFIRHSVAHAVSALIRYKGLSLEDAVQYVVDKELGPDTGGIIAVGPDGSITTQSNTPAMLRGAADSHGRFEVAIWRDESDW